MSKKLFSPSFDSLTSFSCPDWFRDAKFGIWSHWGPQSVPMYGDWYARNMYIEGSDQYRYHVRKYGHPSKFGYKDICKLWKAEHFDPDELMGLYHKAGARYFVGQAMHHDHFFNYPSKLNHMNSTQVGPMKDICGLWKAAADKYKLPFGLTEHLGATFAWWRVNKGSDKYGAYKGVPYDGNDPEWRDFYLDNYEHGVEKPEEIFPWYTTNKQFHDYWIAVMKELIDTYTPDLLYSDGDLPFDEKYEAGLEVVSYLYNSSINKHGENHAIYTQKNRRPEIYKVGVLDVEKSQLTGISEHPWQTDTCIGNWFYDVRQVYKKADQIIEMLIDIVSKNGTMLLNVLQQPDGTIDDEARFLLNELAGWFPACGEAIYGTRPWRLAGEGDTKVKIEGFNEEKTSWNESDIRFTQKNNILYAFLMGAPRNAAVIKSLHHGEEIKNVRILGGESLSFYHSFGVLVVDLPDKLPQKYTNCLAIELI